MSTPPAWTRDMEKQVGDRVNIVLCNPKLLMVYELFGGNVFRRSSVFHGLEKFLADNNIRGKRCFEVGTWNGLTAVLLSQRFEEVVTVDIAHNAAKHEILKCLGIKNVRCVDIGMNSDKADVLRGLTFDCAYLDGNHAEDTEQDFDLVKHCGRVIFHECWPFQEPVWRTVNALPQNQVTYGGSCFAYWDAKRG